jgi:hypothetical protein
LTQVKDGCGGQLTVTLPKLRAEAPKQDTVSIKIN